MALEPDEAMQIIAGVSYLALAAYFWYCDYLENRKR